MAFIDYYKILGVSKDIPQADVKKAYHKRSKQFHPDLHPDDPKAKAKFQALNEAYEVIGDPEKRAMYDRYGENWRQAEKMNGAQDGFRWGGSGGNPFEGFDFSSFTRGNGGFSDFFEQLFGHRSTRGASSPSVAQEVEVNIDLYTALLGGTVTVALNNGPKFRLKIKPETQNGTRVRLRGVDVGGGKKSDLVVSYKVVLPTGLSERQKSLLREMQRG